MPLRQPVADDVGRHARGDLGRRGVIQRAFQQVGHVQRNGYRGQPEMAAFHGRRDRARIGQVVADVLAAVDARHHQVKRLG
jgi:hypothetical protein